MKGIKQKIFRCMPPSWRLPFWYHVHKLIGTAEDEILHLGEYVPPGKNAVDIGANIGLFSYALAKLCPQVEAFEPQSACADLLLAYSRRHARNVHVHVCGLSDTPGELSLSIPVVQGIAVPGLASFRPENAGAGKNEAIGMMQVKVPVKKLDAFDFRNVGFIKIDVEGFEIEVLRGAEQTLLREKPNLLIEIEQRHLGFPMGDIFAWLSERGYVGGFLHHGHLHDLADFSYAEHQQPYLDDVLAERYGRIRGKYINNFIFFPKGASPRLARHP